MPSIDSAETSSEISTIMENVFIDKDGKLKPLRASQKIEQTPGSISPKHKRPLSLSSNGHSYPAFPSSSNSSHSDLPSLEINVHSKIPNFVNFGETSLLEIVPEVGSSSPDITVAYQLVHELKELAMEKRTAEGSMQHLSEILQTVTDLDTKVMCLR